ncbi:bifunctional RecB family nuclease/DEAD/DEAH box helicase [Methylobacterium platani]|uniref:DNA2/NAM7 helicase-like C-terminal domain-containing protein n=1 Tax=Methylobacterium platani TaxID=427683 RepID=A0A179S5W3_9HYPH|nr:AAA domain-containing protein [Methylobacterium platani]OAS22536.1 hypothetical protein A5481_19270 [Methylobacterium platani]
MYVLNKRALAQYLRRDCKRRLRLDLYASEAARDAAGGPPRDVSRPGLALIVEQGREFERQKFGEMADIFGSSVRHGEPKRHEAGEEQAFGTLALEDHIDTVTPHTFLIEAQYEVRRPFIDAHGLVALHAGREAGVAGALGFSDVRPDILHVLPPTEGPREAVTPSGLVVEVEGGDPKLGLRVIDIKLSGEPSPSHFAELAYYGMTLAAWLEATGRSDRFVVLKNAAVWPGKHEASTLRRFEQSQLERGIERPALPGLLAAWEDDLETMPAEVVLGRVRRFFEVDLRQALAAGDWRTLPWFVDNKCSGCDYLGYDWRKDTDPDEPETERERRRRHIDEKKRERSCWPVAGRERHLSMITGLTRGACGKLRETSVTNIIDLAALPAGSPAFEGHQKLRAGRSLFQARSNVLSSSADAVIPKKAGTSAVLPRSVDVRVALSVDYDVGSGLTFAIGYRLVVEMPHERVPVAGGKPWFKRRTLRREPRVMLVEQKSVAAEREVVMEALRFMVVDIEAAAREVREAYVALGEPKRFPTFQVYLWDRLNYEHLRTVMGRHFLAVVAPQRAERRTSTAPMAWLFPPETVIEEPSFTSKNSPVTIVSDAVTALVAADVPHHYSLLGIANAYHPAWMDKDREPGRKPFLVSRFFVDPLSDQIPSERGHEIWNRRSPFESTDFQGYRDILRKYVARRLDAVLAVAERLAHDLKDELSSRAPRVDRVFGQTEPEGSMAVDSEILYQHARLMHAAQLLENELLMAMPPHQREATFASARMDAFLTGAARTEALMLVDRDDLDERDDVLLLHLSERSLQTKIKEGDFTWTLMPETALKDQNRTVASMKEEHPALRAATALGPVENRDKGITVRKACAVKVLVFDRVRRIVVAQADRRFLPVAARLGILDFNLDVAHQAILDPRVIDFFVTKRLLPALQQIKVPPLSRSRPLFRNPSLTRLRLPNPHRSAPVPAERFIWDADGLAGETARFQGDLVLAAARDPNSDRVPTAAQATAIRQSAERRLSLLWGPPGTGKSTTAVALLRGLLSEAARQGTPIRIAVTGPTWVAIDTVTRKVPQLLCDLGMQAAVAVARLSSMQDSDGAPELAPHHVRTDGEDDHKALVERLASRAGSTVVAGTAHQLAKLSLDEAGPMKPFFDFMLVDEASQMSVALAVTAFSTLAEGAQVTVVGDNLQMPPIQPVPPPEGAEHLVGSIYDFYREYRKGEPAAVGIEPVMLDRSYRSNKEIVEFVRQAGYRSELEAAFPDLRMRVAGGGLATLGAGEADAAAWNACLTEILDPEKPLVAVIHDDEHSSQRNDGEAALVSGIVRALRGRLLPEKGEEPLSPVAFYGDGIGIVTPHRAQQAAVVERLLRIGSGQAEHEAMMAAVDTVERFQGQEKTVMVASYGLGDRDQIASEEEFLYSLNRFNVVASRAKAKLVVILSRSLIDYLPRDPDTLRRSRLLKHYADGHLQGRMKLSIPVLGDCELRS